MHLCASTSIAIVYVCDCDLLIKILHNQHDVCVALINCVALGSIAALCQNQKLIIITRHPGRYNITQIGILGHLLY